MMALIDEDSRLFEELLKSREELVDVMRQIVADEKFYRHFNDDDDVKNKLKSVFGASVTGITALGALFAMSSMGTSTSLLTEGVFHSVAVFGIILESVTLVMSVRTLTNDEKSELGVKILEATGKLEMMRQNVFCL